MAKKILCKIGLHKNEIDLTIDYCTKDVVKVSIYNSCKHCTHKVLKDTKLVTDRNFNKLVINANYGKLAYNTSKLENMRKEVK